MIRIAPRIKTLKGRGSKNHHQTRQRKEAISTAAKFPQAGRGSRGALATLTEGVARLQHAVARPLQGEGQLEQLLPELGGDWVGLLAYQRREHLLRRAGRRRRACRAQPRRRRRRAHWI